VKKLSLLLFACAIFLVPNKAHAQSTLERCQAGQCVGFGPPVGPAMNGYIYQDLSQTPIAFSCGKGGAWSACGGSGSSTSNPNTCTANTAMDKCLGVSPYVAIAGDWSVAINQAMADLSTTGGTIHGCGVYPVNGALLDPTGANALLKVPTIPSVGFATNVTIEFSGCQHTTPNAGALSGMTLKTSVDTCGANFVGGQSSGSFTAVQLVMTRTNVVSTVAVPCLNMINASWINAFSTEDVIIGGTGCSGIPSSGAGGIGLQTPHISNNFVVDISDTIISCMPKGAIVREHAQLTNLRFGSNHDCVTFDADDVTGNSIGSNQIWMQGCVNYILGGARPATVSLSRVDIESDPGTGTNILDPSNLISGIVFYKKQSPSGAATISGGTNLLACNLNAISGCFGSVVANPFLENWKSQDGSGTTLANTGTDSTNTATATNVTWSTTATGFAGIPVAVYNGTSSVSLAASATQTAFDGTTPFSACAWFNLSSLTFPSGQTLATVMANLSMASGNPGWRMAIFGTGATPPGAMDIYLSSNISTNVIHVTSNLTTFSAGAVQLGCFTYDGTKTAAGVIPYINGAAVTPAVVTNTLTGSIVSTAPLYIGSEIDAADWFPGALGRVRVYSRKLSASEISAMYAAGPNAI
jgi:Concanavalin A-like lectin/glucanases superfamily